MYDTEIMKIHNKLFQLLQIDALLIKEMYFKNPQLFHLGYITSEISYLMTLKARHWPYLNVQKIRRVSIADPYLKTKK